MSSFFNKIFGDSGEGDRKPESRLPKPNDGSVNASFHATPSSSGDSEADISHRSFGQLADADGAKSSIPVPPASDQGGDTQREYPQGFVRPEKLPVRAFTAGELASLLPPEFINHQSLPAGQVVDLDLTRARQSMDSGRPVVMLSDIYTACPRLFARPITADEDFEVRLPAKRVEALLGMAVGEQATGPSSPFRMASNSPPVADPAPHGQSPFSQADASQDRPTSPFEIVRQAPQEAVIQSSVPLFSEPAPKPSDSKSARVSSSDGRFSDEHGASVASASSPEGHEIGESVKIQLGKALRFVSVDVLGFSARNVPESVIADIPMTAIERRNPNRSATVPLSLLVNGLEPVYRSGFNQADMTAQITIPADALPPVPVTDAEPESDTLSYGPGCDGHRAASAVSAQSPFAAFAREDAEKHAARLRQNQSMETSRGAHRGGTPDSSSPEPSLRAVSEDTQALKDLSKRLSAFREQTSGAPSDLVEMDQTCGGDVPVKPLEPLSELPSTATDPRSKFRDLQEHPPQQEDAQEPFIQTTSAPDPHGIAEFSTAGLDEDDDWNQVELKAVFGLEKTLRPQEVFDLISLLDEVRSAAFLFNKETKYTTEGFDVVAPMLVGLIENVRQLSKKIGIRGAQSFALQTNRGALVFFSEGVGTMAVLARGADISRGSKQRIILILRELVRGL